jgi:tetratricopeptide (TPR) repeat protein/AAA+ ATPase superfamily predicted ATPase
VTRALVILIVVIAAALPVAADDWYQHYSQAGEALEQGDWSEAVRELTEALQRRGDSGAEVRTYGMKFIAYFPYLDLGIAYYHLGQYQAALRAFETEEQLGAVLAAPSQLSRLHRYREHAARALAAQSESEEDRIAEIVRSSLAEAERLERDGRLEQAMQAAGRALAVAPQDATAGAVMDRLRAAALAADRLREHRERAATLVEEGRRLLANGQAARAASLLRQAQALHPSAEAKQLLEQALGDLTRAIEERDRRSTVVTSALQAARRYLVEGDTERALEALQEAMAVEPENPEVLSLHRRLLADRAETLRQQRLSRALQAARTELAAGRYERSLAAANRALALEPGNAAALEHVRLAYREISRQLLGRSQVQNIPPAIRFADLREERNGELVEVLPEPRLRLTGVVIDDSAVSLEAFRDGEPVAISSSDQPVGEVTVTEFVATGPVRPGVSAIRIVATDSAGLSSSSEYAVRYEPSALQRPAVVAALVVLPVGVLLVLLVRRRQRRQRMLRRRYNPFIAGAPVLDDRLFYGREKLIERILETIHNNSLLLHGERRIGKTSLQHHIRRRLQALDDPEFDFYPVYVDLQGTPEERFFATLAEDVFQELEPVLGGLVPGSDPGAAYTYRDLVRDLKTVLDTLGRRSDKRAKLVLLIDEVDELNDYDPRINQRLRSLFMKSFADSLVAVVSGVEIRKQWEKEASPWFNFFEEIEVRPISRTAASALITAPLEGVLRIEPEAVDQIIELSECKPYSIQRLCIALVNRVHEEHRRTITTADVEAVSRTQAA